MSYHPQPKLTKPPCTINDRFLSSNNLEELAHHTQKMYLGMESS